MEKNDKGENFINLENLSERSRKQFKDIPLNELITMDFSSLEVEHAPTIPEDWNILDDLDTNRYFTIGYYNISEVRSALQKTIRRSHPKQAARWAIEMFYCCKKAQTSAWNRLLTIACEDISPNERALFFVLEMKDKYSGTNKEPEMLGFTAYELANMKKSRIISNILNKSKEKYDKLMIVPELKEVFMLTDDTHKDLWNAAVLCLTKNKISLETKKKLKTRFTSKMYLIYNTIVNLFKEYNRGYEKLLENLLIKDQNWRWKEKSHLIYLYLVFIISDGEGMVDFSLAPTSEVQNEINIIKNKVLNAEYKVGIPDYALDGHTYRGKGKNRGKEFFDKVSSLCTNVETNFYIQEKMYFEFLSKK